MSATLEPTTECDILSRVIDADEESLPPAAARALLRWRFPQPDVDRMQDLADRNTEGDLSPEERRELENYVHVGQFVAVLQAKARLSLQAHGEQE
jgi:hypothetical protein